MNSHYSALWFNHPCPCLKCKQLSTRGHLRASKSKLQVFDVKGLFMSAMFHFTQGKHHGLYISSGKRHLEATGWFSLLPSWLYVTESDSSLWW